MSIELKQAAQRAIEMLTASSTFFSTRSALMTDECRHAAEELRTAIQQAESEPVGAREALERIASWSEHPAMLGVDYGSNGVRDYYRKIARDALTRPAPGVPDDVARDAERYRWLRKSLAAGQGSITVVMDDRRNGRFQKPLIMGELDASIDAAMLAASPAQKGGE